jgi:hypothetical protein
MGYSPVLGIDGDTSLNLSHIPHAFHDFTLGPYSAPPVDLVWSCEFVEHVEEQYLPYYMETFRAGSWLAMTFSVSRGGYHHVNIKPEAYWIERISAEGFTFLPEITEEARKESTMRRVFFRKFGLVFKRN